MSSPPVGTAVASTVPRWTAAIDDTRARPSPKPSWRVRSSSRVKGRNRRSTTSAGTTAPCGRCGSRAFAAALAYLRDVYYGRQMTLDPKVLREAREARDRALELQHEADLAQVGYQHAIRRMHAAGGSLREIADTLGISYQRVHQIVDVASGKGALKESSADLACSFCGALQRQVRKLVAGPGVYICERCIDLAHEVIDEGQERSNRWTRLVRETEPEARCDFCGKARREVAEMVLAPDRQAVGKFGRRRRARRVPGVRECSDCLALCDEIVIDHT
jgi:hypothetical protein